MIHKRPGYDPFFAKNPFSPADELVFMGLVARSCHFDVTAGALRAPAGKSKSKLRTTKSRNLDGLSRVNLLKLNLSEISVIYRDDGYKDISDDDDLVDISIEPIEWRD